MYDWPSAGRISSRVYEAWMVSGSAGMAAEQGKGDVFGVGEVVREYLPQLAAHGALLVQGGEPGVILREAFSHSAA